MNSVLKSISETMNNQKYISSQLNLKVFLRLLKSIVYTKGSARNKFIFNLAYLECSINF